MKIRKRNENPYEKEIMYSFSIRDEKSGTIIYSYYINEIDVLEDSVWVEVESDYKIKYHDFVMIKNNENLWEMEESYKKFLKIYNILDDKIIKLIEDYFNKNGIPKVNKRKTMKLKDVLEGAKRARQRVLKWPQWKKDISGIK